MAATVKTRIQLKYDTEANWNKAINFVPLKGEVIIYSADDSHPFCRLKIGDGINKVRDLPFILSNNSVVNEGFVVRETYQDFPAIGNVNTLYMEGSTNTIYTWTNAGGYEAKYGVLPQSVTTVTEWDPGEMTKLLVKNNTATLQVINGTEPSLSLDNVTVAAGFGLL